MWSVVFVLYLASIVEAQKIVCTEQSENSVTFQKSDDLGRYTAEICTNIKPNVTDWAVDLLFNNKAVSCNNTHHSIRPGKLHSGIIFNYVDQNIKNCTFACLSLDFEMIFSSCYEIKSTLYKGDYGSPPYDTFHNITNNFTMQSFEKDLKVIQFINEHDVSLDFYTAAPINYFRADLCPKNTTSGTICPNVTQNCSMSATRAEIRCTLSPARGCYKLWLILSASWSFGVLENLSTMFHEFCFDRIEGSKLSGSDWSVAWVCGALVAASGAALLLWRLRDAIALHKRVLRYWTELGRESRSSVASSEAACKHILLVYGREGPAAEPLWRAVAGALEAGTGAVVHDVFGAGTLAAAARAPAEWVRGMVARRDCRLVVLQTPALACLHPAPAPAPPPGDVDSPLPVCEPLLCGGAVYRVPQFGDTLCQFALRLLTHSTAHPQHHHHQHEHQHLPHYKKYYLATLSGLRTEVFPQVCPYRRYSLPEALPLLVEHLGGSPLSPDTLDTVQQAADHFVLHVRENPDYLLDELVFT